nr:HipA domain-containing protein [Rhodobacter amnigenus]
MIGATDGYAKNFSIALMPGGRFTMTPLYDVLTVQPTLEAGQLQIKDVKLAMRTGECRHYKVSEIQGRHFVETGLAAEFSREQVVQIFEDIRAREEEAFATALAEMPPGFPGALSTH